MIDDWIRLGALIDDDPEIVGALRDAAESSEDMRAALLDALDDAGALAYMEWSDTGVELADAFAALPRVVATGADLDEIGDIDGALDAAVTGADGILAPHGLRTLYLDEGTDACPLVVVAAADVAAIVELAGRLNLAVRVFR